MKKILSSLLFLALGYSAFPQSVKDGITSENPEVSTPGTAITNTAAVNTKAVKDFKKAFKDVNDEKWYQMPDGFRAMFKLDEIKYRVDYDKNGHYLHTQRTYTEQHLPEDVRSMVKSTYYEYAITLIEEVKVPRNDITYIIHLQGKKDWINVRVQNREMEVTERFNKAD